MKYIFLTLFLVHAALAAPHHVEEEIIDEDAMPMALPQIEEGVVEIKMAEDEEIEDDEEGDAEAAFMRMINSGRSHGGIPAFYYNMNRGMRSMMPQNTGAQGYGAQSYGSQGYGPQSYGMYNPMMNGYPGMGGYPGMDPMSQMMGGMGGYPGMDPMSQMMGGMGGYPGMDPMSQMMGGMGGYPGMDPMSQMMEMMSGMGGGMGGYPGMDMMGGGMGGYPGMNPMMNNYPGMGGYPGMDPMSQMMGGMGGMGGYPGMDMMGGMGGMGGYPGMGGMGGYEDMSMGYMKEQPKNQRNAEYTDLKNEDYPTDYTLPCSDHCACDQVCKSKGPSCTCRCPPRCSSPGIIV